MAYKDPATQREYQRRWIAHRRAEWFADKRCEKCGSTDRLELDHIDPSKKITNSIWSWTKERREVELAKCQVLCHDCHLEKTVESRKTELIHGSIKGYNTHHCRCTKCRGVNALRMRQWRAKNRTASSSSSRASV